MPGLSNEERIIASVISSGDLMPVLERGVTKDWFFNPDLSDIFEWVLDHHDRYGVVPHKATVKAEYPHATLVTVTESIDYLLDKMAEYNRAMVTTAATEDLVDLLEADHFEDALALMSTTVVKAAHYSPVVTHTVDSMDPVTLDEEWAAYQRVKLGTGMLGYATGFPTIDEATLGLQPGQLITILAQPKVGKTTLSLAVGNNVYVAHKKSVLFASFEMSTTELRMRQRSLMAGINFKSLQAGKLTPIEEKKYRDHLDMIERDYTWPYHFTDASTGATVSAIEAQIARLEPSVVFIDGIYMMTDEVTGEVNTPQALTNITRALKRLATRSGLPIVINTQALAWKSKGSKISMDSAGYSSSFAQDSDVILGLERVGKDADAVEYALSRTLRILASRNTGLAQVQLIFDYDTGSIEEE